MGKVLCNGGCHYVEAVISLHSLCFDVYKCTSGFLILKHKVISMVFLVFKARFGT